MRVPPVRGWLSAKRGSREGGSPCQGRYWQGLPGPAPRVYACGVETKQEIREFLTSRRARITPEQAGLASYGSRRVPGLRREEVAVLAGVSVPYYTRLERGDLRGVSESVLEALARALELDDAERAHLFDLARAAQPAPAPRRRRQAKQRVRPEVQWTLAAITSAAAFVGNERLDLLAANQLGQALFSELYAAPARPVNTARFVSSIREPRRSSATGTASPTSPPPSCAPPRAATRTTATSQTSSASSPHRARRSAPAGPRTTSASTTPASNTSTIPSSASST
jgi:transcriptional regulator with XRE-family HTH domain